MQRSSAEAEIALWGGYDILPYLTRMNWQVTEVTEDTTRLGHDFIRMGANGISQAALGLAGVFDDSPNGIIAAMNAQTGLTRRPIMVGFCGNVFGRMCHGGDGATKGAHNTEMARGERVKASAEVQSVGTVDPVLNLLLTLANRTADTIGALFVDGHPSSVSGGVMHAHLTGYTPDGATGLRVRIFQGDGATQAAVPGLAYTFTARDAKRLAVTTGTVGTHVQARTDWQGVAGANKAFRLAVGWFRNPNPPA